jgi:hypothetical protein
MRRSKFTQNELHLMGVQLLEAVGQGRCFPEFGQEGHGLGVKNILLDGYLVYVQCPVRL